MAFSLEHWKYCQVGVKTLYFMFCVSCQKKKLKYELLDV